MRAGTATDAVKDSMRGLPLLYAPHLQPQYSTGRDACHAENAPPLPLEKSGKEIFEKRQKPVDRRRKLWYS